MAVLKLLTFLMGPSSTCAALDAKLSEESDSWAEANSGDTQHTSSTLLLPHRES